MAESLAVRWRPRRFADVAGQDHVVAVLSGAVRRNAPPQQVLLAGPSGLGKTTTARIFAAALLCEHRTTDGDACGLCESCLEVTGPGGHPDVIELDAASNGGKDEIRDLAARAVLAPLRGRWKVYIVDEAHGLTGPGGQAFLRLLEEPPGHCLFVLATTDPGKLPVALRGRCVNLEVLPPTREQILANLNRIAAGEDWDLPADIAEAVLAASDPALGMRGTVMTLDKLAGPLSSGQDMSAEEVEALLGVVDPRRLRVLTDAIVTGDRKAAVSTLSELFARPGRVHLRQQLTQWARQQMLAAADGHDTAAFEVAFARYQTLVAAPDHPGALLVAVAQAADPTVMPPNGVAAPPVADPPAPAAGAAQDVERAAAPGPTSSAVRGRNAAPEPEQPGSAPKPTPSAAEPPEAAPEPTPAATGPGAAEEVGPQETGAGEPAGGEDTGVELAVNDPTFVALLNAVGKVSGPAAFVLRRCQVRKVGNLLEVTVPAAQRPKAAASDLAGALAAADVPHPVVVAP